MILWLRIVELVTRLGVAIAEAAGRKRSPAPLPEPLPPSHRIEVERRIDEHIKDRFPKP